VFYRNPNPPATYDAQVRERQAELQKTAVPRERILEMFQKG
jgi:hypothetical protein